MRRAVLLSLAGIVVLCGAVRADEGFHPVEMESETGYVVPEDYALAHRAEIKASIPGQVKIEGFWTPSDTSVIVADRVLRVLIHGAEKDAAALFPDLAPVRDLTGTATPTDEDREHAVELERQRRELVAISANYSSYSRQYVGVIIDGQKLIFCNYSTGTKVDPSKEYVFPQTYFEVGDHFLQCRFEPKEKICSNVSMIGPWSDEGR